MLSELNELFITDNSIELNGPTCTVYYRESVLHILNLSGKQ
jgi:hypothetical protein